MEYTAHARGKTPSPQAQALSPCSRGFQDLLSSGCLKVCLGLIIFLLSYRAASMDWLSCWKTVFLSESIQPQFHSSLTSVCFLNCCLLSLWQTAFLKCLERSRGNKNTALFKEWCVLCSQGAKCAQVLPDTAPPVDTSYRSRSEHRVLAWEIDSHLFIYLPGNFPGNN